MKESRTRRKRVLNWSRVGYIVAAILLIPSLLLAVCTVKTNTPMFIASIAITVWAEYRLGFFRYPSAD